MTRKRMLTSSQSVLRQNIGNSISKLNENSIPTKTLILRGEKTGKRQIKDIQLDWRNKKRSDLMSTVITPKSDPSTMFNVSDIKLRDWKKAASEDPLRITGLGSLKRMNAFDGERSALSTFGTTPEKMAAVGSQKVRVPKVSISKISTPQEISSNKKFSTEKEGIKMPETANISISKTTPESPVTSLVKNETQKQTTTSDAVGSNAQVSTSSQTVKTWNISSDVKPSKSTISGGFGMPSLDGVLSTTFLSSQPPQLTKEEKPNVGLAFDSQPIVGISVKAEEKTASSSTVIDHHNLLTKFYQKHNPAKVSEVSKTLEKYKGKEAEMFSKLARKYKVPNPLMDAELNPGESKLVPSGTQMLPGTASNPISETPSLPFGMPSAQSGGVQTMSPFGQVPQANFGQTVPQPQITNIPGGGQSPRDILVAFYQKYNPTKLSDVDHLLTKYQGREETLFRNLAKKYNLDPSCFGLKHSSQPPGASFPNSNTAFASGSTTGPFGGTSTNHAFGASSNLGGASPFSGFAGAGSGGQNSFGNPTPSAPAPTPPSSGFASFAGPSTASFGSVSASGGFGNVSNFGNMTPFGAPRR